MGRKVLMECKKEANFSQHSWWLRLQYGRGERRHSLKAEAFEVNFQEELDFDNWRNTEGQMSKDGKENQRTCFGNTWSVWPRSRKDLGYKEKLKSEWKAGMRARRAVSACEAFKRPCHLCQCWCQAPGMSGTSVWVSNFDGLGNFLVWPL
jgi:hypothetical protein